MPWNFWILPEQPVKWCRSKAKRDPFPLLAALWAWCHLSLSEALNHSEPHLMMMMTEVKLGLEQDLHVCVLSRDGDHVTAWISNILCRPSLVSPFQHSPQLEVSKDAFRKNRLWSHIWLTQRGREWPLSHCYGISVCWCVDQSESSFM